MALAPALGPDPLECGECLSSFDRSPDKASDAAALLVMLSQSSGGDDPGAAGPTWLRRRKFPRNFPASQTSQNRNKAPKQPVLLNPGPFLSLGAEGAATPGCSPRGTPWLIQPYEPYS